MRISTSTLYDTGASQIGSLQSSLVQLQEQISSGKRMLTPADDPVAAASALQVTQAQSTNTQYTTNRQNVNTSRSQEESVLGSVTTLIQNVKTNIVNAGDASLSDSDRQALATGLQGQLNQLMGLANSTDGNGNYLFGGFQSTSQPFTQSATGAQYNGDQGQTLIQVGPTSKLALSDPGSTVFEHNKTGNGTFLTAAATTNTGSGIISSGSVVNAAAITGDQYSVNFSTAIPTVTANTANTGNLVVSSSVATPSALTGSDYRIDYSAGKYTITRLSDNSVVYPANATFPPAAAIDGLNFAAVSGTPTSGDSFTVHTQTTYSVVDTTTGTTLSSANPYTTGQAISFAGMQFNVSGSPADGDKFTVQPSTNQSIFTTLTNLINALNTPVSGATGAANLANSLSAANNNIDNTLTNVLTVRATIGSDLNQIDSLNTEGSNLDLQYSQTLSTLQDLDYAKALSQQSEQQTVLTAAEQSFVKVSGLSLFNYL